MNVEEIMTTNPISVPSTATIADAWDALQSLDVRHLPVVNEDGELVGIVSDRDFGAKPLPALMTKLLGPERLPLDGPVTGIMSADVFTVAPDDDVSNAAELMIDNKIGAVPVIDPERHVVGIVSYPDVLRVAFRESK
jgi:CBS domain-containing protein